jgi:hypothetical protein
MIQPVDVHEHFTAGFPTLLPHGDIGSDRGGCKGKLEHPAVAEDGEEGGCRGEGEEETLGAKQVAVRGGSEELLCLSISLGFGVTACGVPTRVDGPNIVDALEDGEKLSSHGGGGCKARTNVDEDAFTVFH